MVVQERKKIHDKLITDFRELKHYDGEDKCFSDVQKTFITLPEGTPICEIVPDSPTIDPEGIDYNQKHLAFTAIVYELTNSSSTQEEADKKIDRLSDIEDVIFTYLQRIPCPLEGLDPNIKIIRIDISPGQWLYQMGQDGLRTILSISFEVVIEQTVKALSND